MKQSANVVLCAVAVSCLSTFGLIELSGRVFAQGVPQQEIERLRQLDQQFEQQWGAQFRQLYRTELHFMRLVCRPTKQQFEKIAADGQPALKGMIRKIGQAAQGGRFNDQTDPRTPIAEELAKSIKTTLSPEQVARYQKEIDQRAAARQRAAVLSLIARLDKVLVLTAEQRDELEKVLKTKWKCSANDMQILLWAGQQFPQLPENDIVPILTDTQQTVWSGIPKGNIHFGVNLGMVQGIQIDEELWDDVKPPKKPEKADGKAAVGGKEAAKKVEKK
jgi:hypothetical protein